MAAYYLVLREAQIAWIVRGPTELAHALQSTPGLDEVREEEYLRACAAWGIEPEEE